MNGAIRLISVEWLTPYIKDKRSYLALKFRSKTSLYSRITKKGRSAKEKYPGGKLLFSNSSPQHLEMEHERSLSEAAEQQNAQKYIYYGSTLLLQINQIHSRQPNEKYIRSPIIWSYTEKQRLPSCLWACIPEYAVAQHLSVLLFQVTCSQNQDMTLIQFRQFHKYFPKRSHLMACVFRNLPSLVQDCFR